MRITINYDLFEEIVEAQHGFCLVREIKRSLTCGFIGIGLGAMLAMPCMNNTELNNFIDKFPSIYLTTLSLLFPCSFTAVKFRGKNGSEASKNLTTLSKKMKKLHIDTTADELLDAYKYHVEYEINPGNVMPSITEKKYFNIPANDDTNDEISLVQEHVIGSYDYTLSKGKPAKQKSLQLAFGTYKL